MGLFARTPSAPGRFVLPAQRAPRGSPLSPAGAGEELIGLSHRPLGPTYWPMAETTNGGLDGVAQAVRKQAPGRGLPPVHLWNPAHCGQIDIVIKKSGLWFHEGSPIGREALVRLFSTVLRKDPDGFCLVTPVEKMTITVEDAPFVAVRVDQVGGALKFLTNVGDEVEAGPQNAIRVELDPATGAPHPYLHVRRGLEALIARPVFYELVDMAEPHESPDGRRLRVRSNGVWFDLGAVEDA